MPKSPWAHIDLKRARGGAFARSCNVPKMSASRTRHHRRRNLTRTVLPVLLVWLSSPTVIAQDGDESPQPSSLSYYDDLRLEAAAGSTPDSLFAGVTTEPLNNEVMRFTMPDDGDTYYLRHLTAMDEITIDGVTSEFKSVGAVLMAVHHWNNKVSAVVPEVADVASWCPLKFTIEFFDTASSPRKAAGHLIRDVVPRSKLEQPDPSRPYPTALMGAGRSAVSAPLATLAGVHGLTQVSYGSTSTSFDNKGQYPTFGRVIPSAIGDAYAAVDYLSKLNVTHLAVMFVKDPYGSSYAQAIKEAAGLQPKPMAVTMHPFSFEASDEEIASEVESLKNSERRYIVGILFKRDLDVVMREASRLGIGGEGYFWLFTDSLSGPEDWKYSSTDEAGIISGITGSGVLQTAHPKSRLWRDNTAAYMSEWNELVASDSWNDYIVSKIKENPPFLEDVDRVGMYSNSIPDSFSLLLYDATMSLILASCAAQRDSGDPLFTSEAVFEAFKQVEFEGAYGKVLIDQETASRDFRTVPYSITNIVANEPDDDGMVTFSTRVTAIYDSEAGTWPPEDGSEFIYSDGTTVPPPVLPPYEQELITLNPAARGYGLFLCAVALSLSCCYYTWTVLNRKTVVIRASQPLFLGLLCVGTFIMATSIIPMSMENSNAACQAIPWLFTTGFIVVFSALLSKTSRVNQMYFRKDCRRVVVDAKDVMKPFLFLLTANLAVLISWTAVAPLTSKYIETGAADKFGRSTSAYHSCFPEDATSQDLAFLLLILAINLIALLYANVEAFRGRSIRTQYSESKFIGLTMLILLQAFIIGTPLFFVAYDNPTARFVVSSSLAFILCIAVLLPMFLPKIRYLRDHHDQQERIATHKKILRKKQWVRDGLAYGDWASEGANSERKHMKSDRQQEDEEEEDASPGLEIMRKGDDVSGGGGGSR